VRALNKLAMLVWLLGCLLEGSRPVRADRLAVPSPGPLSDWFDAAQSPSRTSPSRHSIRCSAIAPRAGSMASTHLPICRRDPGPSQPRGRVRRSLSPTIQSVTARAARLDIALNIATPRQRKRRHAWLRMRRRVRRRLTGAIACDDKLATSDGSIRRMAAERFASAACTRGVR